MKQRLSSVMPLFANDFANVGEKNGNSAILFYDINKIKL